MRCLLSLAVMAVIAVGAPAAAKAQTRWAVYVMNADGSEVKKVSRLDASYCGSPGWARDGKRLAFDVTPATFDFSKSHVHVQTLGEATTTDLGAGNTPCFSPDDSQILFFLPNPAGSLKKGIWVMNADGSGREWLSEGERPRWSPDGDKIVYTSSHEGFASIYILDTLTLERTRVLDRGYYEIIGATWSPDGKELALIGYKGGRQDKGGKGELAVVTATANQPPRTLYQSSVGWQPDWSPDGKTLLFREVVGNQERIHLLTIGSERSRMVPGQLSGRNGDAVWSPDGKQIAF
ncbi:MAG: TolB family protein, partial [Pirellulales bacterium]